jgi:uncharacterized membrane protein YdbT with pleckstrin-like domain
LEEQTIFEVKPSYKDYLGWLMISALTILGGIGLILFPLTLLIVWIIVSSRTYRLTNERLVIKTGWIAKNVQEIELYRIQDVTLNQGILQRIFGVGDVAVASIDKSTPDLIIKGIAKPEPIKEVIRKNYRSARKAEGVRTFENVN